MYEEIVRIVAEQLGIGAESVNEDADVVEDLGADSLDIVEIVTRIEETFGLEIPDEDIEKGRTPRAILEYLEARKEEP